MNEKLQDIESKTLVPIQENGEYHKIGTAWKWIFPSIIALLITVSTTIIVIFYIYQPSSPSGELLNQSISRIILGITALICFSYIILKLIQNYMQRTEKELSVLYDLYLDEERRRIIKRSIGRNETELNNEIEKLKREKNNLENSELAKAFQAEKEKAQMLNSQIEFLNEKVEYLTKINDRLIAPQKNTQTLTNQK